MSKPISVPGPFDGLKRIISTNPSRCAAILLLVVGITLRFVGLGQYPVGLNQDEASIGYDSWALLHYGMDRNGSHNPVHLIAWGSGQNSLYAYLSMPFIALLGLNALSVRLLMAIAGVLSLIWIHGIFKRLVDYRTANWVAGFLAICPWHVMASRWALESNLFPAVFLLGLYCLVRGKDQPIWLLAGFGVLGLAVWTYGTAWVFIPVFILVLTLFIMLAKEVKKRHIFIGWGIFLIVSLPIYLFVLINTFKLPAISAPFLSIPRLSGIPRFSTISSVFSSEFFVQSLNNLGQGLLMVGVNQNDGLIWNSFQPYGLGFPFLLPFALAGMIWILSKKEKSSWGKPIYVSWLLANLPILLLTTPNINRLNILVCLAVISAGIGFSRIGRIRASLALGTAGALAIFTVLFVSMYFTQLPRKTSDAFMESLGPALTEAKAQSSPGEIITVSNTGINMPYIFTLFYGQDSPQDYIHTVNYLNPGAEFQAVVSYGQYRFLTCLPAGFYGRIYVFHNSEEAWDDAPGYTTIHFKNFSVAIRK